MPSTFVLGMNAKLYYGTTTDPEPAIGTLTVIDIVKDVTLNLEAGEADITTRGNSGWRATAATLREATVDFEILWDTLDTSFSDIRDAYLNNTAIELGVLDRDRATSGAQGLKAAFNITSFSRNEALEEALTVNVTAKLSTFHEWLTVA